jgi:hypothetical protein
MSSSSVVIMRKKNKTRRSGRKARQLLENIQSRETEVVEDVLGLDGEEDRLSIAPISRRETASVVLGGSGSAVWSSAMPDDDDDEYSKDGASRYLDENEDDEAEVNALCDLDSEVTADSSVTSSSASSMSRREAKSTIDR